MLNKIAATLVITSGLCWLAQKAADIYIHTLVDNITAVLK